MALLGLEKQRQIRVFVRPDLQGRSVSATVALPRDHVSTELRMRLQSILEERFNGESVDYHLSFGETDPARFHFTVHIPNGEIPAVSIDQLEREVIDAARTWDDRLSDALVEELGEVQGHELARRYAGLLPEYYKTATEIYRATFDVARFELLGERRPYVIGLQNEAGGGRAADPAEALQDRRQGGAGRPAADARGHGPADRGGGADPAARQHGRR